MKFYRFVLAFAAVGIIFSGFFYKTVAPNAFDPWWERLLVGVMPLIIFICSFISKWVKNNIDLIFYCWFFIAAGWTGHLLIKNNLDPLYIYGFIMPLLAFALTPARNLTQVALFLAYEMAISIIALGVHKSSSHTIAFIMYDALFCFLSYLSIRARVVSERELHGSEETLWTLFNESTDALFLCSYPLKQVLDCNKEALALFKTPYKEVVLGEKGAQLLLSGSSEELKEEIVDRVIEDDLERDEDEAEYLDFEGNKVWVYVGIKKLMLPSGKKLLIRLTNVTQKKADDLALAAKTEELEKLNKMMVGRELKITEVKEENDKLKKLLAEKGFTL